MSSDNLSATIVVLDDDSEMAVVAFQDASPRTLAEVRFLADHTARLCTPLSTSSDL